MRWLFANQSWFVFFYGLWRGHLTWRRTMRALRLERAGNCLRPPGEPRAFALQALAASPPPRPRAFTPRALLAEPRPVDMCSFLIHSSWSSIGTSSFGTMSWTI